MALVTGHAVAYTFEEMDRRRLLQRLEQRHVHNVAFADFVNLAEGFGFRLKRIEGSHHFFTHASIPEVLNLQPQHNEAKPY